MPATVQTYDWDELNKKTVLTRSEAAAFCRLSLRAFDKRIGVAIPLIKVGRKDLFLRTSLLAYLTKLERKPSR